MNRYILEEFHDDPALRRRLFELGRRAHARALRAGLVWLIKRLTPSIQLRPARWFGRLG